MKTRLNESQGLNPCSILSKDSFKADSTSVFNTKSEKSKSVNLPSHFEPTSTSTVKLHRHHSNSSSKRHSAHPNQPTHRAPNLNSTSASLSTDVKSNAIKYSAVAATKFRSNSHKSATGTNVCGASQVASLISKYQQQVTSASLPYTHKANSSGRMISVPGSSATISSLTGLVY